jgi:hypothetical protein
MLHVVGKRFPSFFRRVRRLLFLLFILSCGLNSLAITKIRPAGVPVGTFRLLVVPVKGGPALPLSAVNVVGPDEKLRYEPVKLPEDLKEKARVSVITWTYHTDQSFGFDYSFEADTYAKNAGNLYARGSSEARY